MINKRIFYVWGANDAPKQNMWLNIQSWKQTLKGYEIIEINEDSKKYFDFQKELNENKWFRTVYERKMWAFVADYVRIKVLYEHGGIYLDTDVTALKSFDDLLDNEAFVGIQCGGKESLVEPAILGATKGNYLLKRILEFYNEGIWNEPIFTMPQIFDKFLSEECGINEFPDKSEQRIIKTKYITIYPEKYFIPFRFGKSFSGDCIEDETYTIHWFGGSWTDNVTSHFLRNKHKKFFRTNNLSQNTVYLFNLIPLLRFANKKNSLRCYLFNFIPLFKYKFKRRKCYLFFIIPLFTSTLTSKVLQNA